jgi:ATP synthase protein I
MWTTVGIQIVAVSIAALIALASSGGWSAQSLLMGGLAAVVPNALFAMRLSANKGKQPESYIVTFFLGEFVKVGLTIAALGLIVKFVPQASTVEVIVGLVIGLKSSIFGLWFTGDRTDQVIRQAQANKEQDLLNKKKAQELAHSSSNETNKY